MLKVDPLGQRGGQNPNFRQKGSESRLLWIATQISYEGKSPKVGIASGYEMISLIQVEEACHRHQILKT